MKNSLFVTIIIGSLVLALMINGIFQSICQQWLGAIENGTRVCRLTQHLPDSVYWTLYFIIAITIFYFLYRKFNKVK